MKSRKLKDGTTTEEYESNVTLNVVTKCPGKYKLIDMETGQKYVGQKPKVIEAQIHSGEKQTIHWKRIDTK
jgi:hypothetical protein